MTCDEAQELITALVDRVLLEPERSSLESHLQQCPHCRLAVEQERLVKQAIRARAERLRAPGELRDRILSDRRIFSKRHRWRNAIWTRPALARTALAASVILAIVLPAFFLLQPTQEPIASAALETYQRFVRGELSVQRGENPDEIVKQLTQAVGGRFRPMGYDLTMMQLRPVAGLVQEIQGRKILIAIYQGQGGTLFCYTFFGTEKDAPPGAAKFFDPVKKMNFYAFSRGQLSAVMHREGEMICILAAEIPMDDLLALARSKARKS